MDQLANPRLSKVNKVSRVKEPERPVTESVSKKLDELPKKISLKDMKCVFSLFEQVNKGIEGIQNDFMDGRISEWNELSDRLLKCMENVVPEAIQNADKIDFIPKMPQVHYS